MSGKGKVCQCKELGEECPVCLYKLEVLKEKLAKQTSNQNASSDHSEAAIPEGQGTNTAEDDASKGEQLLDF